MTNLTISSLSTAFANVMELNLPNVKHRCIDWETFAYLVGAKHKLDVLYASDAWLFLVETPDLKDELGHLYNLVLSSKDHDSTIDFHLEVEKHSSLQRLVSTMSDGWYFEYLSTQYEEAVPLHMAPYETGYDADNTWVLRVPKYYSELSEESARKDGFATAVSLDTRPYKTSREDGIWKLEVNRFLTKAQEESGWCSADYFFEAPYRCTIQDYGPDKGVWKLEVLTHISTRTIEQYEALGFMPAVNIPS